MHSKAPLSANSPTATVDVGSEDCAEFVENSSLQFHPLISLNRDYLARLLFWLVHLFFSPPGLDPGMCWAYWIVFICQFSKHFLDMSHLKIHLLTKFWKNQRFFLVFPFSFSLFRILKKATCSHILLFRQPVELWIQWVFLSDATFSPQ